MNKVKYKDLVETTIIPSNISIEERNLRYAPVLNYVSARVPKRLYRFRTVSERSLSALHNDELWFTSGSLMNDDFDARLYYNRRRITEWLEEFLKDDSAVNTIVSFLTDIHNIEILQKLLPDALDRIENVIKIPHDVLLDNHRKFIRSLLNNLESELHIITEQVQSFTKFACFSTKIHSDMMWGSYSDNARGFALEYNFGANNSLSFYNENDQLQAIGNLFPILYDRERLDTTEYAKYLFEIKIISDVARLTNTSYNATLLNSLITCPDLFMVTKLAIKKSLDWKPEDEWRLFYVSAKAEAENQKASCVKLRPNAIYLGRKISSINEKIVTDIAKDKNIPVYKMDFTEDSLQYRLKGRRIH